ncbi:MAG: hypothetical protein AB1589_44420 [Cyanobacteriota bacterium]
MKKPFSPRSTRSRSEGLRISQEIAAIQAALHKQGYRTRKQPKQPAWKVFTSSRKKAPVIIARFDGEMNCGQQERILTVLPILVIGKT